MKASLIRALLLSLSLLTAVPPQSLEARGAGGAGGGGNGKRDEDRNRGQNQGAARPNAPGGNADHKGGGARNPLTGSSVSGGGNNRPNNPNENRPNHPNHNNNPNQNNNRPGGGGGGGGNNNHQDKRPDNKPNNPAARPAPLPAPAPSTRPAPLPAGPGMIKPAPQPVAPNRPGGGGSGVNNENRPGGNNNNNRPGNNDKRPGGNNNNNNNRPGNNDNRPNPRPPQHTDNRPNQGNRPGNDRRPNFVPGKVVYPNQVTKPANRPNNNVNITNVNNNNINSNNKRPNHPAHYTNRARPKNVNQITTNTNINQNWGNQWNNTSTTIWNNNRVVNNRPVTINANFQNSQNYAYRPNCWGSRPWWSSSTYHTWHHGSWNYGWNNTWQSYHGYYNRPAYRPPVNYFPGYRPGPSYHYHDYNDDFDAGKVAAWGLAAWGLGSLIYDSGYSSYRNPYQAPPVQTTQQTIINYSQPLSVVASREVPKEEAAALTASEKSSAAIERARAEFKNGDYLASLKSTDESISFAPGDSALHEFRALNLFALGRYGDAAGVLNPLLASGPGWDWATMSDFYPSSDTYAAQLRKLEAYVEGSPNSADAHFVLGYHYLVAGFIEESYAMFDRVVTLQPADSVAVQLRNLAESSSSSATGDPVDPATAAAAPPTDPNVVVEPIDPTDIEGGWKAPAADGKSITLTLGADGNFTWNYDGAADGKVLSGEWSIDEQGQLVLASSDVQMVADVSLDGTTLRFVLAGSPVGDPGLSFQRL